jgi:hypothetical protein
VGFIVIFEEFCAGGTMNDFGNSIEIFPVRGKTKPFPANIAIDYLDIVFKHCSYRNIEHPIEPAGSNAAILVPHQRENALTLPQQFYGEPAPEVTGYSGK